MIDVLVLHEDVPATHFWRVITAQEYGEYLGSYYKWLIFIFINSGNKLCIHVNDMGAQISS